MTLTTITRLRRTPASGVRSRALPTGLAACSSDTGGCESSTELRREALHRAHTLPMPLPAGTWKANLNGTMADLTIGAVSPQGMVPVTLLTVNTQGFWNEVAQSFSIGLVVNFGGGVGTGIVSIFEAFLFRSPPNPQAGQDVTATLAGTFRVSAGLLSPGAFPAIPTSRREVFGWYAQLTEVL
jgi:hypothetical protein